MVSMTWSRSTRNTRTRSSIGAGRETSTAPAPAVPRLRRHRGCLRTQTARPDQELMHHPDVVLQPVFLDGLQHEHLVVAQGTREVGACKDGMRASSAFCRFCSALHAARSRSQASATGPDRNSSSRRLVSARRNSARCSAYSAAANSPPHRRRACRRARRSAATLEGRSGAPPGGRAICGGAIRPVRQIGSAALPSPSDMPRSCAPCGTWRQGDACDRPAQHADRWRGRPAGACPFADDGHGYLQVHPSGHSVRDPAFAVASVRFKPRRG